MILLISSWLFYLVIIWYAFYEINNKTTSYTFISSFTIFLQTLLYVEEEKNEKYIPT